MHDTSIARMEPLPLPAPEVLRADFDAAAAKHGIVGIPVDGKAFAELLTALGLYVTWIERWKAATGVRFADDNNRAQIEDAASEYTYHCSCALYANLHNRPDVIPNRVFTGVTGRAQ